MCVLLSENISAQVQMGKWRTHFSYNSIEKVAQSENRIFAVSDGALFSVNKNDESIEVYSKLTGLNDNKIANIAYNAENAQLFIAYINGNIDIMMSGGITNIPDLYIKSMNASKIINDIMFHNKRAYLSTDFGILVVNLEKYEIADTYYIGLNGAEIKVLNTTIFDNYIYATTPTALYRASLTGANLSFYENWEKMSGVPNENDIQKIVKFGNNLVLSSAQGLYNFNFSGNYWEAFQSSISCKEIFASGERLIVKATNNAVYTFDSNKNLSEITFIDENSERFYPDINAGLYETSANRLWLGSQVNGLLAVIGNGSTNLAKIYKLSGPSSNFSWNLTFAEQKLILLSGGGLAAQYSRQGDISIFENNKWSVISAKEIEKQTGTPVLDFMMTAIDPNDISRFFVTSYGTGLYEFKNNSLVKHYTVSNSPLKAAEPAASNPDYYTRTNGIAFDKDGNLFVTNSEVADGVVVLRANGTWGQYAVPKQPTWGKLLISNKNANNKWVISQRGDNPGILVYDDAGILSSTSQHRQRFLTSFANPDPEKTDRITPVIYYCMEQDKNGVIWVGTEQGPLLFYNTENAFNTDYTCSKVKIPRNDGTSFADYLLENERVRSIAIDGANRKWIGTEASGVYLMSENGQETLQHFTMQNSPLPSNNILAIGINPITGEVFFGSASGLVSYQSDATESTGTFANVHAYPNPVRQNFRGSITISGLVMNTRVKITDINGNLIYETTSNGGFATWDGKNLYGNRVATGIYLAICVTEDGSQNAITKIMIIN